MAGLGAGMAASDTPQVRTLLLTDLVESTSLVERLGDAAAAALFRAHDRLVLELQQRWRGRLIDRSDGLLLIFTRPIDGLGFALDYVRGLRDVGREHGLKQPLLARAGLHVGEVLLWENSLDAVQLGAKSLEVEGLAKPLAGRLIGRVGNAERRPAPRILCHHFHLSILRRFRRTQRAASVPRAAIASTIAAVGMDANRPS